MSVKGSYRNAVDELRSADIIISEAWAFLSRVDHFEGEPDVPELPLDTEARLLINQLENFMRRDQPRQPDLYEVES